MAKEYDEDITKNMAKIVANEEGLNRDFWAKMVYAGALYYKKTKSEKILDALLSLWYGRYYNHVHKIKDLTYREAEDEVEKIYKTFKKFREEFAEKYSSP